MQLTKKDIAAIRIAKSGLIQPFENVIDCTQSLFGIQAQAQQFAEINIFNRVKNPLEMYDLFSENKIIKIWAQRMTVHLFSVNDWEIVHHVFSYRNSFVKKIWADNTDIFNKLLSHIDSIAKQEKISKEKISESIENFAPHVTDPSRDYSVFHQATLNGIIFGVPQMPHTLYYGHRTHTGITDEIHSNWSDNNIYEYRKKIISRYFRFYSPATIADFCHWSGLTKTEIIMPFKEIEPELNSFKIDSQTYYYPKADDITIFNRDHPAKLTGKFDPLFVSFSDKTWIADKLQQKEIWRPAAHVEAVILQNSEAIATWRYTVKGNKINFTIYPFKNINAGTKKEIGNEAEKIAGFMDKKFDTLEINNMK